MSEKRERQLPSGWNWVPLSTLTPPDAPIVYGIVQAGPKLDVGVPYIRPTDIDGSTVDEDMLPRTSPEIAAKYERSRLSAGDLVYSIVGTIGKWVIVPAGLEGANINQSAVRIRPRPPVTAKYILHALRSPQVQQQIDRLLFGNAVQRLNVSHVRELEIPLPPPDIQAQLVRDIDAAEGFIGSATAALDEIPDLVERFRQSVLAAAFRGDLTKEWREQNPDVESASDAVSKVETPPRPNRYKSRSKSVMRGDYALSIGDPGGPVPSGWAWTPLLDVAALESGHTPSRKHPEYWDGDIPWVSIPDARDNHCSVIHETSACITQAGLDNSAARIIPEGAVFLCRTAASIGYTLILGRPMATSQDLVAWICTEAIVPKYLMWLYRAEKAAILRFAKGSAHRTVYYPEILSFHVCLPPVAEQHQIVEEIESRLRLADQIEAQVVAATDELPLLEKAVLAAAFKGET